MQYLITKLDTDSFAIYKKKTMYVLKQGIWQCSLSNYFIQLKGTKGLSDAIPRLRKGTPSPNIPEATRNIFIILLYKMRQEPLTRSEPLPY